MSLRACPTTKIFATSLRNHAYIGIECGHVPRMVTFDQWKRKILLPLRGHQLFPIVKVVSWMPPIQCLNPANACDRLSPMHAYFEVSARLERNTGDFVTHLSDNFTRFFSVFFFKIRVDVVLSESSLKSIIIIVVVISSPPSSPPPLSF